MTRRIWNEMTNAKHGDNYLSCYIEFHKKWKATLKIATLLFSIVGLILLRVLPEVSWIPFVLIICTQIISLFDKQIFRSNDDLEQVIELRGLYIDYFNKLEHLFDKANWEDADEKQCSDNFYELKTTCWTQITLLDNKIHIRNWRFLDKAARQETMDYLNQNHKL